MSESVSSDAEPVTPAQTRTSTEPAKPEAPPHAQDVHEAWDAWPKPTTEKPNGKAPEKSNGTNGTHAKKPSETKIETKPDDTLTATGFFSPMLAVSGIFEKPKLEEPKAKAAEPKSSPDLKNLTPTIEETQEMPPVKVKLEADEPPLVIAPVAEPATPTNVVVELKPTSAHLPVVPSASYASDILEKAATETTEILAAAADRSAATLASTDSMPKVVVEAAPPLAETQAAPAVVIEAPAVATAPEPVVPEAPAAPAEAVAPAVAVAEPVAPAEVEATPVETAVAPPAIAVEHEPTPAPVEVPVAAAAPETSELHRFNEAGAAQQPPLHETQIQPPVNVELPQSVAVAEGPAVLEAESVKADVIAVEIPRTTHVAMAEGGMGTVDDEPEEALPVSTSGANPAVQPFSVPTLAPVPDALAATIIAEAPVAYTAPVEQPAPIVVPEPAPVIPPAAGVTPVNEPAIRIPREDRGPLILFKNGKTGGLSDVRPKSSAKLPAVGSEALPAGVPAPKVGRATFTPPGMEAIAAPPPVAQGIPAVSIPASAPVALAPQARPVTTTPVVMPPVDSPFGSPMATLPPPPMQVKPVSTSGLERPMLPPIDSPFGSGGAYVSGVMEVPRGATQSMTGLTGLTGIFNAEQFRREAHTRVPPLLVAAGLKKRFGKREVVTSVDLEVGRGEIVGLLGRNGAGKTTSFRMIVGMLCPDGGNVSFDKVDITKLPMYRRARMGIGYLAQEASIFQKLSVEKNLLAVLELQEPNAKKRIDRMDGLIHDLGLEHVRKSKAATLSGGERRRLEIARTMSLNPQVVLFDEPFAGIDPIAVTEIQDILRQLKKRNVGVLITDHNVRETLIITDRTYIMDEGKIWIHGSPREIVNNPEAKQRYLGHGFRLDF